MWLATPSATASGCNAEWSAAGYGTSTELRRNFDLGGVSVHHTREELFRPVSGPQRLQRAV